MRRILITLSVLCLTLMLNAQTIHWLTFVDTQDYAVGDADVLGRKVLYSRFIHLVNTALTEKGYTSNIQDFYDDRLNPENCRKAVKELTCGPEDIIVFYYIGHGMHMTTDADDDPYPHMLLGCNLGEASKFVPLTGVHEALKGKGARLVATIGMCCNNEMKPATSTEPAFVVNYGNASLTDTQMSSIQKMFLGNEGDFILASATAGQSSYADSTPLGYMDLFTANTVGMFERQSETGELSWENLFKDVKEMVNDATEGEQTPIFESNLSDAEQVAGGTTSPVTISSNLEEVDAICNELTRNFDFVINKDQPLDQRLATSQEIRKMFAPDAVVRVMGQDGDVVVDKEKIDAFLSRISTSRILLKVAPVEYKAADSQITSLKVKEYYKE